MNRLSGSNGLAQLVYMRFNIKYANRTRWKSWWVMMVDERWGAADDEGNINYFILI